MLRPGYIILRIQRLEEKCVDPVEAAYDELSHRDVGCLQIYLVSYFVIFPP